MSTSPGVTGHYIFQSNIEWKLLKNACLGLNDHSQNPAHQVLGVVVSFLHDPIAIQDGSMEREILRIIPDEPPRSTILAAAFTLYMYLHTELQQQQLNHAAAYTLISAGHHLHIELWHR